VSFYYLIYISQIVQYPLSSKSSIISYQILTQVSEPIDSKTSIVSSFFYLNASNLTVDIGLSLLLGAQATQDDETKVLTSAIENHCTFFKQSCQCKEYQQYRYNKNVKKSPLISSQI